MNISDVEFSRYSLRVRNIQKGHDSVMSRLFREAGERPIHGVAGRIQRDIYRHRILALWQISLDCARQAHRQFASEYLAASRESFIEANAAHCAQFQRCGSDKPGVSNNPEQPAQGSLRQGRPNGLGDIHALGTGDVSRGTGAED